MTDDQKKRQNLYLPQENEENAFCIEIHFVKIYQRVCQQDQEVDRTHTGTMNTGKTSHGRSPQKLNRLERDL